MGSVKYTVKKHHRRACLLSRAHFSFMGRKHLCWNQFKWLGIVSLLTSGNARIIHNEKKKTGMGKGRKSGSNCYETSSIVTMVLLRFSWKSLGLDCGSV